MKCKKAVSEKKQRVRQKLFLENKKKQKQRLKAARRLKFRSRWILWAMKKHKM